MILFEHQGVLKKKESVYESKANVLKAMNDNLLEAAVVSNTFSQAWELLPYYQMVFEHNMINEHYDNVESYIYITLLEAQGSWGNTHGVPDEAIQKMARRWERGHSTLNEATGEVVPVHLLDSECKRTAIEVSMLLTNIQNTPKLGQAIWSKVLKAPELYRASLDETTIDILHRQFV